MPLDHAAKAFCEKYYDLNQCSAPGIETKATSACIVSPLWNG
jgi:hypothetical protein